MGSEISNYTITPAQARSRWYLNALAAEIALWGEIDLETLEKGRINHPEILAYKARLLGNRDTVKEYADWTSFLVSDYGPRRTCLSLGSGVGRVERFLINAGFTETFEAIELSSRANKAARLREPRISTCEGDLNFVHLQPERYDFILCHGVLHHLINCEHVLNQMNTALKPDGLLLVYEYVGETRWQFSLERLERLRKLLPDFDFNPPPLWRPTGFESIRSADLLPLIRARFGSACERAVSYGGVYLPFVICTEPRADVHMKRVVALDERISKEGPLPPCYHMGVYRKSKTPPLTARPWSDEELRLRLAPPSPINVQIVRAVKRSKLGRTLRATKRAVHSVIKGR